MLKQKVTVGRIKVYLISTSRKRTIANDGIMPALCRWSDVMLAIAIIASDFYFKRSMTTRAIKVKSYRVMEYQSAVRENAIRSRITASNAR
jgi:hypothetical protein